MNHISSSLCPPKVAHTECKLGQFYKQNFQDGHGIQTLMGAKLEKIVRKYLYTMMSSQKSTMTQKPANYRHKS